MICEILMLASLCTGPDIMTESIEQYVPPPPPIEEVVPTIDEVLTDTVEPATLTGVARDIADCESGTRRSDGRAHENSYGTHLENQQGSTASGLFHFLDGTWQWVNAEIGGVQYSRAIHAPEHIQLEAFYWLWDDGNGASHWHASKSCWG